MKLTSYSWFNNIINFCNIPIGCDWGIIIQNGGSTSLEEEPVYTNRSLKFRSFTDLWCQVFRCTTESLCCCSVCDVFFAKTKVSNFNMTLWVKQEIFQLSKKVLKSLLSSTFYLFWWKFNTDNIKLITFYYWFDFVCIAIGKPVSVKNFPV